MGLFGAVHGWRGVTLATIMKLCIVIPSLKKIQKTYESRDKTLGFC